MQSLTLDVKTVTPLFIAGADQSNLEGEGLRPPTLRGLMRWWFRAMMGGMANEEDLWKKECSIFGSASIRRGNRGSESSGESGIRSKIRILTNTDAKPDKIDNMDIDRLGLGYLWFPIKMQARRNNKQRMQRSFYYPQGSMFSITIKSEEPASLKIAAGALWATIYLGGAGSRMRRGAGSFEVFKADNDGDCCDFYFRGTTKTEAKRFLEDNLRKIFNNFKGECAGPNKLDLGRPPPFCVLSRETAEIFLIDDVFTYYNTALSKVGDVYRQFRHGMPKEERVVFGLPIMYRNFKSYADYRFASPLHMGVMKIGVRYVVRLLMFHTSTNMRFRNESAKLGRHLGLLANQLKRRFPDMVKIEIPEVA